MSVHHEISKKVKEVNHKIEEYRRLDAMREKEIDVVIEKAKRNEEFTLDHVNQVTAKLNQHAALHHLPSRLLVTKKMVMDICHQS